METWGVRKDIHPLNIFADGNMGYILCQARFWAESGANSPLDTPIEA
jgi:hypothetical protein